MSLHTPGANFCPKVSDTFRHLAAHMAEALDYNPHLWLSLWYAPPNARSHDKPAERQTRTLTNAQHDKMTK